MSVATTFVRDPKTGIVINTDDAGYNYILAIRQKDNESRELCNKLQSLEGELTEIKMLLQAVMNGKNYG
jgi:hypothetical protein